MAAIILNSRHQAEHVCEQLRIVGASLHQMLDAFVSYRMRLAAAAAEQVRPREVYDSPSSSTEE
jgi:hypothetical protein